MITPRVHTFPTPEPIELDLSNPSGDIQIDATARGETRVTLTGRRDDNATREAIEQTVVEFANGRLQVHRDPKFRLGRGPSLRIEVSLPDGSSVRVRTASADTKVTGRIDSLDVNTASGDVTAEDVDGEARLHSASGDLRVRSVTGDINARTASGDINLGYVESVELTTASGDVKIEELGNAGRIRTVSGDQQIGRVGAGEIDLHAVSGDLRVGVAEGALAHLTINTVSGTIRTDLPVEESAPEHGVALQITARTVSGDISLARARAARRP